MCKLLYRHFCQSKHGIYIQIKIYQNSLKRKTLQRKNNKWTPKMSTATAKMHNADCLQCNCTKTHDADVPYIHEHRSLFKCTKMMMLI